MKNLLSTLMLVVFVCYFSYQQLAVANDKTQNQSLNDDMVQALQHFDLVNSWVKMSEGKRESATATPPQSFDAWMDWKFITTTSNTAWALCTPTKNSDDALQLLIDDLQTGVQSGRFQGYTSGIDQWTWAVTASAKLLFCDK